MQYLFVHDDDVVVDSNSTNGREENDSVQPGNHYHSDGGPVPEDATTNLSPIKIGVSGKQQG